MKILIAIHPTESYTDDVVNLPDDYRSKAIETFTLIAKEITTVLHNQWEVIVLRDEEKNFSEINNSIIMWISRLNSQKVIDANPIEYQSQQVANYLMNRNTSTSSSPIEVVICWATLNICAAILYWVLTTQLSPDSYHISIDKKLTIE